MRAHPAPSAVSRSHLSGGGPCAQQDCHCSAMPASLPRVQCHSQQAALSIVWRMKRQGLFCGIALLLHLRVVPAGRGEVIQERCALGLPKEPVQHHQVGVAQPHACMSRTQDFPPPSYGAWRKLCKNICMHDLRRAAPSGEAGEGTRRASVRAFSVTAAWSGVQSLARVSRRRKGNCTINGGGAGSEAGAMPCAVCCRIRPECPTCRKLQRL